METDALKQLWRSAAKDKIMFDQAALAHELRHELGLFDKAIKKRNNLEIKVAALLIPVVAIAAFFVPSVLSKAGLLLLIPYCLLVIYKLKRVKQEKAEDYSMPLKTYLRSYKAYLFEERNLLDTVLYWYLLPPAVCTSLFFVGLHESVFKLIIFAAINTGTIVYIYRLNKAAVKNEIDPLIQKIETQLEDLEKEEQAAGK